MPVHYWRTGGKTREFPELSSGNYGIPHIQAKPNFGVAIGGGGYRAATLASGWIRGLHNIPHPDDSEATILSRTKYLSTISGSSWFNGPFSYMNPKKQTGTLPSGAMREDADSFLGPYYPPEKLVVLAKGATAKKDDELNVVDPPCKSCFDFNIASQNTTDRFLRDFIKANDPLSASKLLEGLRFLDNVKSPEDDDKVLPWTDAIRTSFLQPYGLHSMDSTVSAEHTTGHIADQVQKLIDDDPVFLACVDPDRPYPIIIGAAFNAPGSDGHVFYPYEFTPLYVGTPATFGDAEPALGGGYVQPLGLNAVPQGPLEDSETNTDASGEVNVKVKHLVPLSQMVAISSSFFASGTATSGDLAQQKLASTEELVNWGLFNSDPKDADPAAAKAILAAGITPEKGSAGPARNPASAAAGAPMAKQMGFADGGSVDNNGVMPLLRRKVEHIVICVAADQPADQDWETYAKECCDAASYFGVAKATFVPRIAAVQWNDNAHVFGKDQMEGERLFRELYQHMHAQLRKGGAPYYRGQYTVRDNDFHNVEGGWEVDVLWVFNQQARNWENSLPKATRTKLETERGGLVNANSVVPRETTTQSLGGWGHINTLHRFPYFTTYALDYNPAATNMLSQLASWVMMEARGELQDMMMKAGSVKPQTED